MSVMLGDMAVTEVVRLLNSQLPSLTEESTPAAQTETKGDDNATTEESETEEDDVTVLRAYKYEKPENISGEYIAVNHLPFVHRYDVCEGTVNINVHVPKLKNNGIPSKRLSELAQTIVGLFPEGTYLDKAYYEFMTDSRPTLDGDGTYYINIQLNVIFNNLND